MISVPFLSGTTGEEFFLSGEEIRGLLAWQLLCRSPRLERRIREGPWTRLNMYGYEQKGEPGSGGQELHLAELDSVFTAAIFVTDSRYERRKRAA